MAVVDIQRVFKSYYQVEVAQKEIDRARAHIQKVENKARVEMKKESDRVLALTQQLKEGNVSPEERSKLQEQREIILSQLRKANREFNNYSETENRKLDQQMQNKTKGLLEEIRTLVNERAKAENYALVFDCSGTNANQVPSLIYGKSMIDITAVLIQRLNQKEQKD